MIDAKYALFTRIQVTRAAGGRLYCDPLWAKDLKLHLHYIRDFRLCCPVVAASPADNLQALSDISDFGISKIFDLAADRGWLSVARNFFPNFVQVIRACKASDIVHSSGSGWAFPLSFYILLLRPFLGFKWITVIESSDWMRSEGEKVTPLQLVAHHVYKFLLTRCVRSADARIFTQSGYRKLFLDNDERTLVAPAVWIDKEQIASRESVLARAAGKTADRLKLVFPARLIEEKGVRLLFETVGILAGMNKAVDLDIIGSGTLAGECRDFAKAGHGSVQIVFHEPVEYGPAFFRFLQAYDAVLVPNLKEEQPRIVFDAFSQGVAVIASDTSGIKDVVEDSKNAILFRRGDAGDFARAISHAADHTGALRELGLNGLASTANRTHAGMHLEREQFLKKTLNY